VLKNEWFKSSFSGNTDNSCVEVRYTDDGIEVRDTKNRDAGQLSYTRAEWAAFLAGVHNGEFEL
jgi:Domain of unknown function (DUF397)